MITAFKLTMLLVLGFCCLEVNRTWSVLAETLLLSQLAEVDFLLIFTLGVGEAVLASGLLG